MKYTIPNLKSYYEPEIDVKFVVINLLNQLKEMHTTVRIQHVKQQQGQKIRTLTRKDNLNFADKNLATEALSLKTNNMLILPDLRAKLYLEKKMCTAHHSKIITQAFHSIQVRQYFTETYDWSYKTQNIIWWSVHGRALTILSPKKEIIIQKLIHCRIPCNIRKI
jgi:hypothetical protein